MMLGDFDLHAHDLRAHVFKPANEFAHQVTMQLILSRTEQWHVHIKLHDFARLDRASVSGR